MGRLSIHITVLEDAGLRDGSLISGMELRANLHLHFDMKFFEHYLFVSGFEHECASCLIVSRE